jgi:hypothetical protein
LLVESWSNGLALRFAQVFGLERGGGLVYLICLVYLVGRTGNLTGKTRYTTQTRQTSPCVASGPRQPGEFSAQAP